MKKTNLTKIPRRETAGRDTTLRFEYQHRFAAEAALEILEDSSTICVFCDFHDDYVVQRNADNIETFEFVQVKTNKKEKHQWDIPEVFGVNKTKAKSAKKPTSSFIGKLFYHQINFGDQCSGATLLTNVFFVDDIDLLVDDAKKAAKIEDLSGQSKKWFNKISDAYKNSFDKIDSEIVFSFLKKIKLRANSGPLNDEDRSHSAIFLKKIYDYSEIELTQPEAYKIYEDLISKVREKSMSVLSADTTPAQLKEKAGIILDDLLSILSLSKDGYTVLKNGGDVQALKATSRLQRFLTTCGASNQMIGVACRAKVEWDNWIRQNRHAIGETDLLLLTQKCTELIQTQNALSRNLSQLINEFESISRTFLGKMNYVINKDLVFGLFLSLIINGEN